MKLSLYTTAGITKCKDQCQENPLIWNGQEESQVFAVCATRFEERQNFVLMRSNNLGKSALHHAFRALQVNQQKSEKKGIYKISTDKD